MDAFRSSAVSLATSFHSEFLALDLQRGFLMHEVCLVVFFVIGWMLFRAVLLPLSGAGRVQDACVQGKDSDSRILSSPPDARQTCLGGSCDELESDRFAFLIKSVEEKDEALCVVRQPDVDESVDEDAVQQRGGSLDLSRQLLSEESVLQDVSDCRARKDVGHTDAHRGAKSLPPSVPEERKVPYAQSAAHVLRTCVEGEAPKAAHTQHSRSLLRTCADGEPRAQDSMFLMRLYARQGDVQQALALLRDLDSTGELDTIACNCALDVCVSAGDFDAARQTFEEMKARGMFDAVSYNIFMKQHVGESGVLQRAVDLVTEMRTFGLEPTTATYNSLLGGAVAKGDMAMAWQILGWIVNTESCADSFTVSILFRGMRREARQDGCGMDRVLRLVTEHSMRVDEVLVSSVLEALLYFRDARRTAFALGLFNSAGWEPSKHCGAHTLGYLLKAYGLTHQLEAAWRLWRKATKQDRPQNEQLYIHMIEMLVNCDAIDAAKDLVGQMKTVFGEHLSSQAAAVAYSMVITGFARRKDSVSALKYYDEMKLARGVPDVVTFNTLLDACCRVGDTTNAARLFREMVTEGCTPDIISYSTLIKGFCHAGDLNAAMEHFMLMKRKEIVPDAIVFNSLLDGCAKSDMLALCEELIQDMIRLGITVSNYSLSIMIKLYGRRHNVEEAMQLFEEMPKKHGFRPNTAAYTCLMATCIGNNRLDLAMDLQQRMVKENVWADRRTYSTLLRGAVRSGNIEACTTLISAALDQGEHLLDEQVTQSVLSLIQRRGAADMRGRAVLSRLRPSQRRDRKASGSSSGRVQKT